MTKKGKNDDIYIYTDNNDNCIDYDDIRNNDNGYNKMDNSVSGNNGPINLSLVLGRDTEVYQTF